jgi:hypothetical protein
MNDEEKDALARRLIAKIVADERERADGRAFVFKTVLDESTGETGIIYSGTGPSGQGAFSCAYWPLDAVRRIIAECEQLLDGFEIKLVTRKGESSRTLQMDRDHCAERLDIAIEFIAESAARTLLLRMGKKIAGALDEVLRDTNFMAQAITSILAIGRLGETLDQADFIEEIEHEVQITAAVRRQYLTSLLKGSGIRAEKQKNGDGAPKDRQALARIKNAYGDFAKQEDVARKLRMDPDTLRATLKEYGFLDWKDAVQRNFKKPNKSA